MLHKRTISCKLSNSHSVSLDNRVVSVVNDFRTIYSHINDLRFVIWINKLQDCSGDKMGKGTLIKISHYVNGSVFNFSGVNKLTLVDSFFF